MTEKPKPKPTGLDLLREPFPANQISKLPKPTAKQTADVKGDFKLGIRCKLCGAWHHKDVVHLDYVGHAALTDRLLDADPAWNWEPMALTPEGLPVAQDGMWIKLTVCGVTRLGYGDAEGKTGGNAVKEMIGDALRNAAMRFGAALDLWHKGDLHGDDEPSPAPEPKPQAPKPTQAKPATDEAIINAIVYIGDATDADDITARWKRLPVLVGNDKRVIDTCKARKAELANADDANIPYEGK